MTGMRALRSGGWIWVVGALACGPKQAEPEAAAEPAPSEPVPASALEAADEPLLTRAEGMPWSRCGGFPEALRSCTPYTCELQDNRSDETVRRRVVGPDADGCRFWQEMATAPASESSPATFAGLVCVVDPELGGGFADWFAWLDLAASGSDAVAVDEKGGPVQPGFVLRGSDQGDPLSVAGEEFRCGFTEAHDPAPGTEPYYPSRYLPDGTVRVLQTCEDYPANLESCTPYTCEYRHPFNGDWIMEKEIRGMSDGACQTYEEMPMGEAMTCAYDADYQVAIAAYQRALDGAESHSTSVTLTQDGARSVYEIDGEEVSNPLATAMQSGVCQTHEAQDE